MRLFNEQFEFYCGIDLHANSMHTCVIDRQGKKRLNRSYLNAKPDVLVRALAPFQKDFVVGCESTFQLVLTQIPSQAMNRFTRISVRSRQ